MSLPHLTEYDVRKAEYNARTAESMKLRNVDGGRSRKWLRENGYVSITRHNDLLAWGVKIIAWLNPRELAVVFEYCPVNNRWKQTLNLDRKLERMTAMTYEEQAWIHKLLGAPMNDQMEMMFAAPEAPK